MMRALTLVPTLTLVLLVGGQVTLIPGQAHAWCCGCMCMSNCTCDGQKDSNGQICWYCKSTDREGLQAFSTSNDDGATQLNFISKFLVSAVANSDMIERVTELRLSRPCFREKVAFHLLGENRAALKIAPVRFDGKKERDQVLMF